MLLGIGAKVGAYIGGGKVLVATRGSLDDFLLSTMLEEVLHADEANTVAVDSLAISIDTHYFALVMLVKTKYSSSITIEGMDTHNF